MKRNVIMILLIVAGLLLSVSCGTKEEIPPITTPAPVEASPTPEPEKEIAVLAEACASREQLVSELQQRGEREGELDFVARGESSSELIATMGDIVYVLRDYSIEVCQLKENKTERIASIPVGFPWEEWNIDNSWHGREKQCASLLCDGERLVVLSDLFAYGISSQGGAWLSLDSSRCVVDIFDVSNPASPRWMRSFSQSGSESTALLSAGNLLLVTDREVFKDESPLDEALPGWWQGEEWNPLPASSVYLCDRGASSYLQLGIYSLADASEPQFCALLGCGTQCLLSEQGLYGLVPTEEGNAVYYLPIKNGTILSPLCSFFAEPYTTVSALTGAGDRLCLLQDGTLLPEGYLWHRRFGANRFLALRNTDYGVRLSLLSGDAQHEEICAWILGWDFRSAAEEDRSIFTDAERGLIGLPSEDGYTLMRLENNAFSHVLDCYSWDFASHRRTVQRDDILYVIDMDHVFTIDLSNYKLSHTLNY